MLFSILTSLSVLTGIIDFGLDHRFGQQMVSAETVGVTV
jgi:hypothetical protein